MSEVSPIVSSCKDCCFARYEGKTQVDCELGRLEKFGPCVLEAEDEDKQFFLINGRLCLTQRTAAWADRVPRAERAGRARHEVALRCSWVVLADRPGLTQHVLELTVRSLWAQAPAPPAVGVVFPAGAGAGGASLEARHFLREESPPGVAYKVTDVVVERTEGGLINEGLAQLLKGDRPGFYGVVHAGTVVPHSLHSRVDAALNDALDRFVFLKGHDYFLAQTGMSDTAAVQEVVVPEDYPYAEGETHLEAKLRVLAREAGAPWLVRLADDV